MKYLNNIERIVRSRALQILLLVTIIAVPAAVGAATNSVLHNNTPSEVVETLISMNIIAPDKVAEARALLVADTSVPVVDDTADINPNLVNSSLVENVYASKIVFDVTPNQSVGDTVRLIGFCQAINGRFNKTNSTCEHIQGI